MRFDRGTVRSAGFVSLLTVVFLFVNASVAHAATGDGASGDLLAPLNITSSEGVPIEGYELRATGGSVLSFKSQAISFLLSGLFTLTRLLVGLAGWAIEFAFRFPLLRLLAEPAQAVSDAYKDVVVDSLGLKGLLLSWAFVFGLVMFMRGRVSKGLGEIVLTLVIAGFAASAFVRPDYLLSSEGPLLETQQAAGEVAQLTVDSYSWGGKVASGEQPCASTTGGAERECFQRDADKPYKAADVARPIQDSLTNALIVKPYMLLQYGRILDPGKKSDKEAYSVHLQLVSGGLKDYKPDEGPCEHIWGDIVKKVCIEKLETVKKPELTPGLSALETDRPILTAEDQEFAIALALLDNAGPVGKAAAKYAETPTWSRAGGAALLLIAALLICAMQLSASIVLIGTQAADVAAAACGVVAMVAGMLPGPSRQVVWKWLSVFVVSMLATFAVCMFIPLLGIAMDVVLTDGPDLMVERLLLLDVLAVVGLAMHRYLLSAISVFGRRMAMRMRYAKVGGSHMAGDSELGAALAMHSAAGGGGQGMFVGGLSGAHQRLGSRHRILGSLSAMGDGAGMPFSPGALVGAAAAEGRRGLAPLALAGQAGQLGLRGAYGALIGKKPPQESEAVRLLRIIALGGADGSDGAHGGSAAPGGGGMSVNRKTGEILHDPSTDRPLLGSRIHAKASRLRAYRAASAVSRFGYGATVALPGNVKAGHRKVSEYTQDAQTQLRVAANQARQDAAEWVPVGQAAVRGAKAVRDGAVHASQQAPVAVRNAAASAVIVASGPLRATSPRIAPSSVGVSVTRQEDPVVDARRRVFDALMQAQRASWPDRAQAPQASWPAQTPTVPRTLSSDQTGAPWMSWEDPEPPQTSRQDDYSGPLVDREAPSPRPNFTVPDDDWLSAHLVDREDPPPRPNFTVLDDDWLTGPGGVDWEDPSPRPDIKSWDEE
ncbi:hypothetical protein AB0C71_38115 [Streptomyces anulatus]|uniref:hypothetical protein n=1 Tax=Streptomyces anulatus TaxID=1892 RepID=UPI0033CFA8C1